MKGFRFIRIFSHPLFIAAVITLFVSPLLLKLFPRYYAEIAGSGIVSKPDCRILWADVMNDGESEKLEWFNNSEGKATYKLSGQSGFLIDLQIFNGEALAVRNPPAVTDLDRNSLPEIYAFYHRNDSLFFTGFEYQQGKPLIISEERYVVNVPNLDKPEDYDISYFTYENHPGNNPGELVFSVNAGYPGVPRNVYLYNLFTGELVSSAFTGAFSTINEYTDINADGQKEYLIGQFAPGNLHDTLIGSLNDLSVRLIVLDSRLDTLFHPVEFEDRFTGIELNSVTSKGETFLVAYLTNNQLVEKDNILKVYTSKGKLLSERKISDSDKRIDKYWIEDRTPETNFRIAGTEGFISTFDLSLNLVKKSRIPEGLKFIGKMDIDQDSIKELIFFHSGPPYLLIKKIGWRHPARVKLLQEYQFMNPCLKKNRKKPNELSLQSGDQYLLISYGSNPFYLFRLPVLLALWGLLSGFVFLIQYLQRLVLRDKYLAERHVSELQLLLMRNQLSPHFLFNAINSVSYRLMEKNPEEANNSILRLSRLIRNNLVATDRFSRTLKDELETASAYIEIVQSQCEEPFQFIVKVDPATDLNIQVPVMVIQNYLENAVKHGVGSMGSEGRIGISVSRDTRFLFIRITDNGVGRLKAKEVKEMSNSTGKGMGLMQQFFDEINKYNESKIVAIVIDLYDEQGSPAGTRVDIDIPVNIKYRIYEK